MKNVKLTSAALALVLVAASCKKNDFQDTSATATATTAAALNAADTLHWQSSAQWQKADQGTFAVHYFTIQDSSITSDVADNGLVLLFKKNGTSINALPFEEVSANGKASDVDETASPNYWYHQVATGSLLISCDVYKAATTPDAANSFKYFVLTPQKLQNLQTAGYTTEKLMSLTYAETAALLKQ